jgi:hypothetical protein
MMLRDLVVSLDGIGRDDAKLTLAIGLVRRHDAHRTGCARWRCRTDPRIRR